MPDASVIASYALMGAGLVLVARNVVAWRRAAGSTADPDRALWLARGFRTGIVGLCAIAFGAGWLWDITWLMILSAIIAGEELLETTVLVMALRDGKRLREREAAALSENARQR